jgi:hypothetical protein
MGSMQRTIARNIERNGFTPKAKKLNKRIGKAASRKGQTRAEYIAEQEKERSKK